jgi:iron complex transport system substrate-binding protein
VLNPPHPSRRRWLRRGAAWAAAALAAPAAQAAAAGGQRLVCIGGALTEAVYALGAQAQLVGVDTTSLFPASARELPSVGYARALSAEGVLSLRPGLVLAGAEAGPPAVLRQLQAAGLRLEVMQWPYSLAGVEGMVQGVGTLLGRPAALGSLLSTLREQAQAAQKAVQSVREEAAREGRPAPRLLFVLSHSMAQLRVAGHDTAADAMLRLAGGRNAFGEVQGYKPLTPEAVIAAAPDVIVATDQGLQAAGGVAGFLRAPGLAATPAGRAGRVVALDALWLLGFGPRTASAVQALAQAVQGALRRG